MAKGALGRGLGALISDKKPSNKKVEDEKGSLIDIKKITANRFQPRRHFSDETLSELTESIKEKGIVLPLVVRALGNGSYELIAGERRLRAAKSAGLTKVPAIIRKASDEDSLELALIENIQRENLNPVDEALAYQRLTKEFKLTQEQIASKVGKKRATVSNILRLLTLPRDIQDYLQSDHISMGHARAILALSNSKAQNDTCLRIIAEGLSVRETERIVNDILHPQPGDKKKKGRHRRDPHIADLEDRLQKTLGTQVVIRNQGKKGRIEIYYHSLDEFGRVIEQLGASEEL